MNCPACDKPMMILEHRDVEVDFCPACRGCWLDQGELELILQRTGGAAAAEGTAAGRRGKRRCPHCRRPMRVRPFPGTAVEVDACPQGHGIWLDGGELPAIARAGGAAAAHVEELFGAEAGTPGKVKETAT